VKEGETAEALSRLSLNQATIPAWTVVEAADGCARAGLRWIGLWRDRVAEVGIDRAARAVRDAGLGVSSVCRGGWFGAPDAAGRRARMDDNRRAVDEAATLGAACLVLVCGPAPDRDLERGRRVVAEAIAELLPYAAAHGVCLAIEPLHPMYCGDRSVVVTLAQALEMAAAAGQGAGVAIDSYHVWWDPGLWSGIDAAGGRILGFHVNDWLVPTPDMLNGRGLMGDGVIELRRLRRAVDAAGYEGPIEVEIFNERLWSLPPDEALSRIVERYLAHVVEPAAASPAGRPT
jgi:sugar phosphate isomerase/epimerase